MLGAVCNCWAVDKTCSCRFRLIWRQINRMCSFSQFLAILKSGHVDLFMLLPALITETSDNFLYVPHVVHLQAACGFCNVIILDSRNISMHTYALPMHRCCAPSIAMLVFIGALVLLRGLYGVINAITAVKAHRQWQRRVLVVHWR